MKKIITPLICLTLILLVLLNIDRITDKIISFLYPSITTTLSSNNPYKKDYSYSFVTKTTNFTPYGKQDLLDIFYTVIDARKTDFTFYCPKEYQNCITDTNNISKDANLLTHLNNFVHPFNSFTSINTSIKENGEITLTAKYLYTEEQINEITSEVKKLIDSLVTPDLTTNYDKIKVIHDYIINETKYDIKNTENLSFNAYGALFNHYATCNGYTDLMAIFLSMMGYENFKVATTGDENTEGHVWNAVYVDNEWLHLDLTWDDPVSKDNKDYLYHKYFLIDTEELKTADSNITSKEHVFDPRIYPELN